MITLCSTRFKPFLKSAKKILAEQFPLSRVDEEGIQARA